MNCPTYGVSNLLAYCHCPLKLLFLPLTTVQSRAAGRCSNMKKRFWLVCFYLLLFPCSLFSQKYYYIKYLYDGTLYDAIEISYSNKSIIRTAFKINTEDFVSHAEYKHFFGKNNAGDNYCLTVCASTPTLITKNTRTIALTPCYFYRTWKTGENPNKAPLYWDIDNHKKRDPGSEKYKFAGRLANYRKGLTRAEIDENTMLKFLLTDEDLTQDMVLNGATAQANKKVKVPVFEKAAANTVPTDEDMALIQEAKFAMSPPNKDYVAALKALKEVSVAGRRQRLFVFYAAVASDSAGNYPQALHFYKQYLEFSPGNEAVINKIARLSYRIRKSDPTGTWVNVKSLNETKFQVVMNNEQLTIKSVDNTIVITMKYTSQNTDGSRRFEGRMKVPMTRHFKQSDCTICSYRNGLKAYCAISRDNKTIDVYVKRISASLKGHKDASGSVVYDPCCKVEEFPDFDYIYQLERE